MDRGAVVEIVERFRKALAVHGVKASRIILFGSHASGDAREGSDIDLVVVSEDFAGKDFWGRIDVLSEAIYEVFEPIEAIAMTPEEWERGDLDIVEYAREGDLIYSG